MKQLRSPSQVIVWFFPMTINRIKKTGRSLERQKNTSFSRKSYIDGVQK